MKRKSEVLVGLTTLFALIILLVFTLNIKKSTLLSKTYELKVYFKKIKGLEMGAPVHVYGVIAGEVRNISYQTGEYPVLVTLAIKKKIRIFRNAKIRVSVAGLIGETKIEIDAGTPDTGSLQDGEDINGSETMDFTQVLEMTPTIMENMSETIRSIRSLLQDQNNRSSISSSLNHIESLTSKLDTMITTDTHSIGNIMDNLNNTINNLNKVVSNINSFVNQAKDDIAQTGDSLNTLLVNTDNRSKKFFDDLGNTMNDARTVLNRFDGLIENNDDSIKSLIKRLDSSSQKLESTMDKIEKGDGTLGLLIKDPTPFYDLRDSLVKIKKLLGEEEKVRYEYDIKYHKDSRQ